MNTGINGSDQMSASDLLTRLILWGVVGYAGGLQDSKLGWCAFLGPIGERVLGVSLEDMAMAAEW